MTSKETKQYLEMHPELIALLDIEDYETFFQALPWDYHAPMLWCLDDLHIEVENVYTIFNGMEALKTSYASYDQLVEWAKRHNGRSKGWYITNDETGEIVWINDET